MPCWRKVRQGVEVVIERDSRPVAVLKTPQVKGRKISEVIAALEASGANAVIDEDFARHVEEAIKAYREPWNPHPGTSPRRQRPNRRRARHAVSGQERPYFHR